MAARLSDAAYRRALWPLALAGGLLTLLVHASLVLGLMQGLDQTPSAARRLPPVRVSLLASPPAAAPIPPPAPLAASPARPRFRPTPPGMPAATSRPAPPADTAPPPVEAVAEPAAATSTDAETAVAAAADAEGPVAMGTTPASPDDDGAGKLAIAAPTAPDSPGFVEPVLLYGSALARPAAGRSRFQVYYGDYASNNPVAVFEYDLETNGDRYAVRTEGRALGLISLVYGGLLTQVSRGRLGENGLMPERYVEQRGRGGERGVQIDRERGRAEFSNGAQVALEPGTQDRLSMLIQIGLIARAQPEKLGAGQRLRLPELGTRAIHTAVFESLGDALLPTRQGDLRTVHLVRRPADPQRDPEIDIWLGYDHQLMPVRIRLTDSRGRVLDQLLMR